MTKLRQITLTVTMTTGKDGEALVTANGWAYYEDERTKQVQVHLGTLSGIEHHPEDFLYGVGGQTICDQMDPLAWCAVDPEDETAASRI